MPIGPNAEGQWVDPNYECIKCGTRQPLPECEDKYCPKCGTRQPGPNMQLEAENLERLKKKVCPKSNCRHENVPSANYCTECGTQLPQRDSIMKSQS